ncbi:Long-chain-fatty-acid--CoA ligase [Moorella thermoacetica]|uniref:class I adenylate-forming enzyme family protein n=1 Tax=Neomoorella thermoacetica TaxID=1525 RepID=UPI00091DDBA4|nr:class I adenylate-forming enzyme family protein [Moorella thermoacetica]OIQ61888.1 long-chain-fatty-acid--CoA ligase [Moorella thermoacetica]
MAVSGYGKWFELAEKDLKTRKFNGVEYRYYDHGTTNLWEDFSRSVSRQPDKTALRAGNSSLSYREMQEASRRLASGLWNKYQVKKGDVVALLLVNSIDFCLSFYAAMYLGAIALPLSTKLKATELNFMLKDSGARILITNPEWLPNVLPFIKETSIEQIIVTEPITDKININFGNASITTLKNVFRETEIPPAPVDEQDGAVIMYTSGTTGKPKGAYLTHFNLLQSVISYERTLQLTAADSTLIAVPIFHITGLAALFLLFMHIGGTVYLLPFFNTQEVLNILTCYSITFFHAAPTVYIMLLEQGYRHYQLPDLRKAACGGGAIPIETIKKIKTWIPQLEFHTVYGLTETSSPATLFPGDVATSPRIGTSGIPIPVVDCKVIDAEGRDITGKGVGELCIRGPVVTQQYWNNDEATTRAFQGGWFRTGDVARIDGDGYVYIMDRLKDMINRGGEKIYSLEVENVIYSHPGVKEVAVIGSVDPIYGEVARAVVVPNNHGSSITGREIQDWVRARLAKYKVPQYVNFVNELPKNANGKIDKKLLRQQFQ